MYDDLIAFFQGLINQTGSYDIASAEFRHRVADDPELHQLYADWCYENGLSERDGFDEFCNTHSDARNAIWESLNDYDDEM